MQISIKIAGGSAVKIKLQKLGQKLYIMDEAMRTIGQSLDDYYAGEAFLSQGGVYSAKWPRLSPGTSLQKAKHYAGRPPEVRTGKMISGFRFVATSRSVRVYNRMPYFQYQQEGTRRLPAREMIGVNRPVMNMIKDIIEKDVNSKLKAVG
jgi:hypothetical protein